MFVAFLLGIFGTETELVVMVFGFHNFLLNLGAQYRKCEFRSRKLVHYQNAYVTKVHLRTSHFHTSLISVGYY